MAGRKRKSKKQSSTSPNKPPESFVFFIELSLGSTKVYNRLREAGATVEKHIDHFKEDEDDVVWLRQVGTRGWIVLMRDERIRRRAVELEALIRGKIPTFILSNGQLSGDVMADSFARALHKMVSFVKKYDPPFIAKVYINGNVLMWFDSVELPKALDRLLIAEEKRKEIHGKH